MLDQNKDSGREQAMTLACILYIFNLYLLKITVSKNAIINKFYILNTAMMK